MSCKCTVRQYYYYSPEFDLVVLLLCLVGCGIIALLATSLRAVTVCFDRPGLRDRNGIAFFGGTCSDAAYRIYFRSVRAALTSQPIGLAEFRRRHIILKIESLRDRPDCCLEGGREVGSRI